MYLIPFMQCVADDNNTLSHLPNGCDQKLRVRGFNKQPLLKRVLKSALRK